jgi:hypothetical protein
LFRKALDHWAGPICQKLCHTIAPSVYHKNVNQSVQLHFYIFEIVPETPLWPITACHHHENSYIDAVIDTLIDANGSLYHMID